VEMSKLLFVLVCLVLVGCAATTQLGNKVSGTQSYVFSTAPKDVTFDTALSAMINLHYNINNNDKDGGLIIGSRTIMSLRPLRLTVNVSKVDEKVKLTAIVKEEGAIDSWDITGSYYKYQDSFYKKLKEELNAKGYEITK